MSKIRGLAGFHTIPFVLSVNQEGVNTTFQSLLARLDKGNELTSTDCEADALTTTLPNEEICTTNKIPFPTMNMLYNENKVGRFA